MFDKEPFLQKNLFLEHQEEHIISSDVYKEEQTVNS